jgi:uncharacterized membrane protein
MPASDEDGGEDAKTVDDSGFVSLMGHAYRGEVSRATAWRARLDRTTNWAVVLTATLLTWAFSSGSRPHYVLLVGVVMVTVFLGIEARRYRIYDIWRSRVRLLEENVFAEVLHPKGKEQSDWRELLSDDLREPAMKTPVFEAVSRRLRRVYFALISVLVGAWGIRITVFADGTGPVRTATVGRVPGEIVVAAVVLYYVAVLLVTIWSGPGGRKAKGEIRTKEENDWK